MQPNLPQTAVPKVPAKRVLPLSIKTITKSSSREIIEKSENTKGYPATRARLLKTTKSLKSTPVELGLISEINKMKLAGNSRITRSFSLYGLPKSGRVHRAPTIKNGILTKVLGSPTMSQQQKFKMLKSASTTKFKKPLTAHANTKPFTTQAQLPRHKKCPTYSGFFKTITGHSSTSSLNQKTDGRSSIGA